MEACIQMSTAATATRAFTLKPTQNATNEVTRPQRRCSSSSFSVLQFQSNVLVPRRTTKSWIPKANATEPDQEKMVQKPQKPVYSLKKGQIVRVDKEKYLNSINYLSVGHPPYYKGLDYIYEDRGEVLDIRIFETGEYALIAWVGIPTAPAWLPTDMLIKV